METQLATRRRHQRHSYADPTTMNMSYTPEELEFLKAIQRYKEEKRRPYPSWHEVLEVLKSLGYMRIGYETDPQGTP